MLYIYLSVRLYVSLLCLWRIFQTPDSIIRLIPKTVHLCGWTCRINEYFKAMSKQTVIGNMYRMHICSIFTHVPAQISNSCDSAVVYIIYLLSYVLLRDRSSQSRRNICFVSLCKTLPLYCVIHVQPRKRHDWNMVHCNVDQCRRALKHLVIFQAFVVHTSISRVTTSVKAGISEPFEQPTLCFDKGEWTSKWEYFDPWILNVCVCWYQWLFTICR